MGTAAPMGQLSDEKNEKWSSSDEGSAYGGWAQRMLAIQRQYSKRFCAVIQALYNPIFLPTLKGSQKTRSISRAISTKSESDDWFRIDQNALYVRFL